MTGILEDVSGGADAAAGLERHPSRSVAALQLDALGGDRGLLRVFLDAHGDDRAFGNDRPRRALAFTLLHEFGMMGWALRHHPDLREAGSLEALPGEPGGP
jgi:hypothetical protein